MKNAQTLLAYHRKLLDAITAIGESAAMRDLVLSLYPRTHAPFAKGGEMLVHLKAMGREGLVGYVREGGDTWTQYRWFVTDKGRKAMGAAKAGVA